MEYIDIPVYEFDLEQVVQWYADIHTGSKIDFMVGDDRLILYTGKGKSLIVDNYDSDTLFKLIESNTDDYDCWYECVRSKCSKQLEQYYIKRPFLRPTKQDLFNIYLNRTEYTVASEPAWYVGDIRVRDSSYNEEYAVLLTVSMEIRAAEYNMDYQFTEIKHSLEDKLVELYLARDDNDIRFPKPKDSRFFWRDYALAKMIFEIKGVCNFEEVAAYSLRQDHIKKTKYPWLETVYLQHPLEPDSASKIREVTYVFPIEETWADVIKAMGFFSSETETKDNKCCIKVCAENIGKTIRFMQGDKVFQQDIIDSFEIFRNVEDKSELLQKMEEYLLRLIVAHELGHMTFRSIRNNLSLKENESLANWFSCLFADEYERKFMAALIPYQGEEYQDFITIPNKYRLKRNQYENYCHTINSLLRSW